MAITALILTLFCVTLTRCAAKDLFFDKPEECDTPITVGESDSYTIYPRQTSGASGTFSPCAFNFMASSTDERVCINIQQQDFSNSQLQLEIYDQFYDTMGVTPIKEYYSNDPNTKEVCSSGQRMSVRLNKKDGAGTPDITALELKIEVVNMQGSRRNNYLNRDCGAVVFLDRSSISVQNRVNGATGSLKTPCQISFSYNGTDSKRVLCFNYQRLSDPACGYELKVKAGTTISAGVVSTMNCKGPKTIEDRCLNSQDMVVELSRTKTNISDEAAGFFTIKVKEGYYTAGVSTTFIPVTESPYHPIRTGIIVAIAIAVIVVCAILITVIAVCICKKNKGHTSVPQHDDHDKL